MSFFYAPSDLPSEPPRLRTVWRFGIFGVGFGAVQMAVSIVLGIGFVVYLVASGGMDVLNDPVRMEELVLGATPMLTAISAIPMTLLLLGLCWICRRYLDRRDVASMGLVRPARRLTAGIVPGFLFGLAPIVIASAILCAVGGFQLEGFSVSAQMIYMIPTFALMAFQEEIVFRGYLLQNLIDIRRTVFGVIFTSILFWLIHALNPSAWASPIVSLNLFGAGVLLALAYRLSGNIWFPTAMHFAWNLGQGVLFSIPVSGLPIDGLVQLKRNDSMPGWLTGGEFGLEGSILIFALEVAMIAILAIALRFQPATQEAASEIAAEQETENLPDADPY